MKSASNGITYELCDTLVYAFHASLCECRVMCFPATRYHLSVKEQKQFSEVIMKPLRTLTALRIEMGTIAIALRRTQKKIFEKKRQQLVRYARQMRFLA